MPLFTNLRKTIPMEDIIKSQVSLGPLGKAITKNSTPFYLFFPLGSFNNLSQCRVFINARDLLTQLMGPH